MVLTSFVGTFIKCWASCPVWSDKFRNILSRNRIPRVGIITVIRWCSSSLLPNQGTPTWKVQQTKSDMDKIKHSAMAHISWGFAAANGKIIRLDDCLNVTSSKSDRKTVTRLRWDYSCELCDWDVTQVTFSTIIIFLLVINLLQVTCNLFQVTCNLFQVTCNLLHVTCHLLQVTCNLLKLKCHSCDHIINYQATVTAPSNECNFTIYLQL